MHTDWILGFYVRDEINQLRPIKLDYFFSFSGPAFEKPFVVIKFEKKWKKNRIQNGCLRLEKRM